MTSGITTGITFFFIIFGFWAANLVCYHPQQGLNPLSSPVTLAANFK